MSLRRNALVTTALLLFLFPTISPTQAVTVGAVCKRVGAVAWHGTTKVRCTKLGKRLVWRATPTTTSLPSSTTPGSQPDVDQQLGTPCQVAGYEMLNPAGPIRCVDGTWTAIAAGADSVASRAYRNLIAQYWAHPDSTIKLAVTTDATTAFLAEPFERSMRTADRLWSVNASAYQPYPALIAHDGTSLHGLMAQRNLRFLFTEQTIAQQEADYGYCAAGSFQSDESQPWFSFCFTVDAAQAVGQDLTISNVGAHEFTHLAEYALMGDILGRRRLDKPVAPWFLEGMASYTAMALSSVAGSTNDPRPQRIEFLKTTSTSLADYNSVMLSSEGYLIGEFASEAFYALEGTGAMEKVLQACRTGLKFDAALKLSTGMSLNSWTPVLSSYVDSVKAEHPLTLAQLQAAYQRAMAKAK